MEATKSLLRLSTGETFRPWRSSTRQMPCSKTFQNAPDQPVTVEGVQAIRETLNLWAAAFDELRVDIEEYIDGPDAVICAAHWQGQGKTSGISIDVHQFDLYEFREGRVIRAVLGFRSKNEALEAAGLRE